MFKLQKIAALWSRPSNVKRQLQTYVVIARYCCGWMLVSNSWNWLNQYSVIMPGSSNCIVCHCPLYLLPLQSATLTVTSVWSVRNCGSESHIEILPWELCLVVTNILFCTQYHINICRLVCFIDVLCTFIMSCSSLLFQNSFDSVNIFQKSCWYMENGIGTKNKSEIAKKFVILLISVM